MIGAEGLDEAQLARITATMALKKIATPEDVASQVVALASDRLSGHVTGQVVMVAGGMEGGSSPDGPPARGPRYLRAEAAAPTSGAATSQRAMVTFMAST